MIRNENPKLPVEPTVGVPPEIHLQLPQTSSLGDPLSSVVSPPSSGTGSGGLIAEQLSRDYYAANDEIRLLGLSRSPAAKFALLLLSWWDKTGESNRIAQVKLTLSHQEIADILGTTRETISHLFAKFERKHLVERVGRTMVIRNRQVLEWISLT